ncbi:MAG TPA: AMP-binding protein [Treponemataceae bacterium]|nr:AMP-binding protein [Treponemataceae bacterium]
MDEPLFTLAFDGTAAVTDNGVSVSYTELKMRTDGFAARIPERALVFILASNTLDSLVGYVGCLNHRIVPLMLPANIDKELFDRFVSLYHPDFIWQPGSSGYELTAPRPQSPVSSPLYPELALLLTTSGSTGSPKLVRQSYTNIRANTESIVEYLNLDSTERAITTLPMNYTYGLSIINTHLFAGATLLLTDRTLMQRDFWNFFNAQNATSFGGVPYTYEMLDKLMFFRRKLPSLRTMTQAGGKLLPALHRKFAEYAQREGKNFVVMYGQAEATARMAYLPPERALDKVGAMGIVIPGGTFTLVDADGQVITKPGITGELVYEGANVTLGYAEKGGDLAKGDERGGKLLTGDMAQMDDEGFFTIVGRKKRFLKIFGNRVNLDETERLIKGHFPDLDCACGGVDDKMAIYITDEAKLKEVQVFVAAKTHLNFSAFRMVYLPQIPKNASGKTLYAELPG